MFDVEKLASFAIKKIKEFAALHQNETFYGFAIDASYLCMNSLEAFEKTLAYYRKKFPESYDPEANAKAIEEFMKEASEDEDDEDPGYVEDQLAGRLNLKKKIEDLKFNPGDWYRIAKFSPEDGFDEDLYQKHYDLSDEEQKTSKYGLAMDKVLEILKKKNAFKDFKKTDDFLVTRVEHDY